MLDARIAVSTVLANEHMILIGGILLIGGLIGWLVYIVNRWSWMPRKHQRERFGER